MSIPIHMPQPSSRVCYSWFDLYLTSIRTRTNFDSIGNRHSVTLHSDGYANDDSSYSERREFDEILPEFKDAGVPIHTVAHSSGSDFQTLNRIANETGLTLYFCSQYRRYYRAIKDAYCTPWSRVGKRPVNFVKGADVLVVVDPIGKRVLSGKSDLLVLQVSDPDSLPSVSL